MNAKTIGRSIATEMLLFVAFTARAAAPPTVAEQTPTAVTNGEAKVFVGTVKASERAEVTARITGTIWRQNFREGGEVRKGAALFELEDTAYRAALDAAQATLRKLGALLAFAEKEVKRYRECLGRKSVSESDFDRAVQTRDTLLAEIDAARADIALKENDLSYTKILSPLSGIAGETKIRPGNNVTPDAGTLVSIVSVDPIQIQFALSEADYFRLFENGRAGARPSPSERDEARPSPNGRDKRAPPGTRPSLRGNVALSVVRADGRDLARDMSVDFADNEVDRSTGTLMVQLSCANADRALIPGGYVQVWLTERYAPPALAVPVSALVFETGGAQSSATASASVFVVDPDSVARRRAVALGEQIGDLQIVTSGLSPTDRVVTAGLHKVRDGEPVAVAGGTRSRASL